MFICNISSQLCPKISLLFYENKEFVEVVDVHNYFLDTLVCDLQRRLLANFERNFHSPSMS